MNELKLIEEFWRDSEGQNFSREATVLFYHLLFLGKRNRNYEKILMHPATLLCKIKDFSVKDVEKASEELQSRGYLNYTPADGNYTSGTYTFIKGVESKQPVKK